jgi:hypothetical protein
MTVLARSKLPELDAGYLLAHVAGAGERERSQRAQWLRTAILLAGIVVSGAGLVLGLSVVWTQLARALPLTGLLQHRRTWRALLAIGAGLVLILGPRTRRPAD